MASNIEKEFAQYEFENLWPQIFQKIKNEASLNSIHEKLTVNEAKRPENRSKNRYRDVSPYDHSRVVLQRVEGDSSDYINASLIQVPESNRTYILSQGPLEHTSAQFWQMIWEQKTKAIVMLNRVIEKGALKCHQYWPLGDEDEDEEMVFEETGLKVTLQEEQENQHYIVRTFDLEDLETHEVREVYHFQYITWPDFGVPSSPDSFLMFLDSVKAKGVLESDVGPAVIHCSAGIGRSGTFCLVDSALVLVEKSGTLNGINIQSLLLSMRSYRMGLIQTYEQLKFSYKAIIEGARKITKQDSSQAINDLLDNYRQREEEAPPPPQRVESLSPNRRGQLPPRPPPRSFPVDNETEEEPETKHRKLDTDIPQKPPRAHEFAYDSKSESEDDDFETLESWLGPKESRPKAPEEVLQHKRLDSDNNNPNKNKDSSKTEGGGDEVSDKIDSGTLHEQTGNSVTENSDTQLRQRRQEERQKRKEKTKELIDKMKGKQKQSETWKKRKSYLKPIAIGISILLGTYLIYKFYW